MSIRASRSRSGQAPGAGLGRRPRSTLGVHRGLGLALAFLLVAVSPAAMSEDGYSSEDANACLDCHENSGVLGILETKHGDADDPNSPAAQKQCQSCHGPSAKHMEFPLQVENLHFGEASKVPNAEQNQQCLACHEENERTEWKGSAHGFENVLCSGCHSIHQPKRVILKQEEVTARCTESCHDTLMAGRDPASFSHPIGMELPDSGTLVCSTCHDPHGPLASGRCIDCHSQAPEVIAQQSEKARRFHRTAAEKGTECIRCHKGLAHPIPPLEARNRTHSAEPEAMAVP